MLRVGAAETSDVSKYIYSVLTKELEFHFASAVIFGGVGYWVYDLEKRQQLALDSRKRALVERRERAKTLNG